MNSRSNYFDRWETKDYKIVINGGRYLIKNKHTEVYEYQDEKAPRIIKAVKELQRVLDEQTSN